MAEHRTGPRRASQTDAKQLTSLRAQIDEVDLEILKLLNRRARLVSHIGEIKKRSKRTVYIPSREREIEKRLVQRNEGPFPNEGVRAVFREIVSASRSLERPLRVAYLGPEATFTHLAALKQFGNSADHIARQSIAEVFDAVGRSRADYGVVPIENSNEGAVNHTLDLFAESDLKICAEVLLPISHDLLSRSGRIEDVERVVSHAQAIAQCRKWIERNLANVSLFEVQSTALAAKTAVDDPSAAAIASEFAAELYGLKVIRSKIEDHVNNMTRFLVIGRDMPPPSPNDITSLMFSIKKDEVGALYHVLECFARHGINLTKIESRPMKHQAWEYIFFLDLEAHVSDPAVRKALEEVEKKCFFLKVMGSYPRAE